MIFNKLQKNKRGQVTIALLIVGAIITLILGIALYFVISRIILGAIGFIFIIAGLGIGLKTKGFEFEAVTNANSMIFIIIGLVLIGIQTIYNAGVF